MVDRFNSVFAKHLEEYIQMRVKMGFTSTSTSWHLKNIDRLACEHEELGEGISKAFSDELRKKRPNESERHRYKRVQVLAQFSRFLEDKGVKSYQPLLVPYPTPDFIPYIFSVEEIEELFKKADNLRLHYKSSASTFLFCFPAIIRLIYATGIRISEAIALKMNDVNIKKGYLTINVSKNGKQRNLPFSESISKVLKQYLLYREKCDIDVHKEYFFVSPNGRRCNEISVRYYFKKCYSQIKSSESLNTRPPRVHDLRHTFAVRSLAHMLEEGIELYASLPILSTYLGHSKLESTEVYVRITANSFPDLIKDANQYYLNVFPKRNYYEAD